MSDDSREFDWGSTHFLDTQFNLSSLFSRIWTSVLLSFWNKSSSLFGHWYSKRIEDTLRLCVRKSHYHYWNVLCWSKQEYTFNSPRPPWWLSTVIHYPCAKNSISPKLQSSPSSQSPHRISPKRAASPTPYLAITSAAVGFLPLTLISQFPSPAP